MINIPSTGPSHELGKSRTARNASHSLNPHQVIDMSLKEGGGGGGEKRTKRKFLRNDGTMLAGSGGGRENQEDRNRDKEPLRVINIPSTAQGGGVPNTPAPRTILSQGCGAYSKTCFSRLQSRLILILHLSELVRPLRWNQITLKRAQKESAENH